MTQSAEQPTTNWLTQKTYDRLHAELEDLRGPKRTEVIERISAARDRFSSFDSLSNSWSWLSPTSTSVRISFTDSMAAQRNDRLRQAFDGRGASRMGRTNSGSACQMHARA